MTNALKRLGSRSNGSGVSFQDGGFDAHTVREMLAKCIIQMATAGVRDQRRLRDAALEHRAQHSLRSKTDQACLLADEPCSLKNNESRSERFNVQERNSRLAVGICSVDLGVP